MKQAVLIIIKPDGMSKQLAGNVLTKLSGIGLSIVASRIVKTNRALAEKHYAHLNQLPFFEELVDYFCGKFHKESRLIAMVYYGEGAIKKCRQVAGATNPEKAAPGTIRGSYGRITTSGLFENVVHVSSDAKEAKREIQLWFEPDDITMNLYPTKAIEGKKHKKKAWK